MKPALTGKIVLTRQAKNVYKLSWTKATGAEKYEVKIEKVVKNDIYSYPITEKNSINISKYIVKGVKYKVTIIPINRSGIGTGKTLCFTA